MIRIKRIYDAPSHEDGKRILIDRLWPRGIKKEDASIDEWIREIAPSTELRKWFNHDPDKWDEFKSRFFSELQEKSALIDEIVRAARKETVTLLYGSKEEHYNNAAALEEYIKARLDTPRKKKAARIAEMVEVAVSRHSSKQPSVFISGKERDQRRVRESCAARRGRKD